MRETDMFVSPKNVYKIILQMPSYTNNILRKNFSEEHSLNGSNTQRTLRN